MADSSPFREPVLRADLPLYPPLLQVLRVTSVTTAGPGGQDLYSAYTQQSRTDTLMPRDREDCYANDIAGSGLAPGYYLGRLTNSYNGLPVYDVLGFVPSPPPTCNGSESFSVTTYKVECESLELRLYSRVKTVTLAMTNGCLSKTENLTGWVFERVIACCDPECQDVPPDPSSIPSSAPSSSPSSAPSSSPGYNNNCCDGIPEVLNVTVTNKTGTCTCLNDNLTITRNVSGIWSTLDTGCGSADINLQCFGTGCSGWQLNSTALGFGKFVDLGCSCDPLSLVFTGVNMTGVCTGSAKFTVTV